MPSAGKLLLRLPAATHQRVKERAERLGVSINALLERFIAQGLASDEDITHQGTIVPAARKAYGDDFIGLLMFGSRARGDAHDLSDTDLLLVVADSVKIERDMYRMWDRLLPEKISLHIAHLPDQGTNVGSLWLECALDARVLFDPTGRIAATLRVLKERIASGRVVRREIHGQGYWVTQ